MTVVFFWSAAARAVAPASPILFSAAGQHTRDPEPKSAPHDSKPKHARKGSSHENARGPTLLAGRAQPEARGRAKALSLPAHWARLRGGPRHWAQASPSPPSPAATRARSRTVEVDCRDRRVLLERGRQSCRAGGADAVACGGAAHPRPRAQVSATRFQAEARAREARTITRGARARWQGMRSPRRATAQRLCLPPCTLGAPARRAAALGPSVTQPLHPPQPPKHARALSRLTFVTVVFFWSAAARAVAPAS